MSMARPVGHPDGSLISSLANEIKWAGVGDRAAATAPAREAFRDRFIQEAREKFGDDLASDDLARRAEHLRRAHFKRMALRSAQARRKRAAQPDDKDAA
jgi:hypothetical protein